MKFFDGVAEALMTSLDSTNCSLIPTFERGLRFGLGPTGGDSVFLLPSGDSFSSDLILTAEAVLMESDMLMDS